MSAGRHALRPRYAVAGWLGFLVIGCGLAVVSTIAVPDAAWPSGIIQAIGVGAAVVGILRNRPASRSAWWMTIVGAAGWIVADALYPGVAALSDEAQVPVWVGLLLLAAYVTIAGGLALLTRRPGSSTTAVVDATIIGAAGLVLLWTFVIQPVMGGDQVLRPGTVLGLGHAGAAAVIVVAVLRLSMLEYRPVPASILLATSALTLAIADVAVAAPVSGAIGFTGAGTLTSQVWPVLLGAAALHPAAAELRPVAEEGFVAAVSQRRFVLFVVLSLIMPATPVGVAAIAGIGVERFILPTLAAVAVSVLLVVRLGLIARMTDRQTQDLRRSLFHRAALERELRHRATHDPLTGLANRSLMLARLEQALSGPGRTGTVLLIDLDGFREVNDTLGHTAGDEVLVQAANRLRTALPDAALIARLGGDEFAVLCNGGIDGRARARSALEVLRPAYRAGDAEVYLTGSAGVLDLLEIGSSVDALRDADLALTAAKDLGKNQIVLFDPSLRESRIRRSDLAARLRKALATGALTVHYQPVVDLADGRMAAVEALVRWFGDDGEPIPPMDFIPVAEETGLIVGLGELVLRQACTDAYAWYARYGIAVTVNVSGQQLREPGFVDTVLSVLTETGLPGTALVLELTETTMITELEATTALEVLRGHGVRVAIDDFGTGYSSLSYMLKLPVDILKIDREFTSPSPKPVPHHWAFVRAILDLATSLRLLTIAEGVENDQQAHTLRNLGCPLAQGFLYSRPVPASAVTELLSAWNARFDTGELPIISVADTVIGQISPVGQTVATAQGITGGQAVTGSQAVTGGHAVVPDKAAVGQAAVAQAATTGKAAGVKAGVKTGVKTTVGKATVGAAVGKAAVDFESAAEAMTMELPLGVQLLDGAELVAGAVAAEAERGGAALTT